MHMKQANSRQLMILWKKLKIKLSKVLTKIHLHVILDVSKIYMRQNWIEVLKRNCRFPSLVTTLFAGQGPRYCEQRRK